MYLAHFGLTEFPFGLTPDTHFYYNLPSHKDALDVLLISLQNGEGFLKITGNVGTGKTMLCRKLLNELNSPYITAYIPNPHLTATELYFSIAKELGISIKHDQYNHILDDISEFLLKAASNQQQPVLIIDEAQSMPIETLEALRLITNLETEKQKLFQVILFGQPELDELLQQKSIRQLRQRISFSYTLKKLTVQDVNAYVKHRLMVVSSSNKAGFSKCAYSAIHFYSKGIPRLVNILAHKALLSSYGKGLSKVGFQQVRLAARDTEETKKRHHPLEYRKSALFALILSLSLFTLPLLNLTHSNQSVFEMSLLNQVLLDLEKRTPDNRQQIHQSTSVISPISSQKKFLYIPFAAICLSGFFVYLKFRPDIDQNTVVQTKAPQQLTTARESPVVEPEQHTPVIIQEEQPETVQKPESKPKETESITPKTDESTYQEKQKQLAVQLYETAIKQQNPADKQLTLNLALEQDPKHIEARLLLANTMYASGLKNEAINVLDQGTEIAPDSQQLISLRRQLSAQNRDQPKVVTPLAINDSEKLEVSIPAVPVEPLSQPTKKKETQQAKQLLKKALQQHNLADKQGTLEEIVRLDPQHIKARLLLAHTLFNQGLIDQAEQFLDQCLALFPQHLKFINLRSQLFLHNKQPKAALHILLQVNKEDIEDETYLSFLAAAYQQNHDNFNSLQTYQKLISINSEKAEYWLGLAITLEKQGQAQPAHDAYQQALIKNPLKMEIVSYIKERISALK